MKRDEGERDKGERDEGGKQGGEIRERNKGGG